MKRDKLGLYHTFLVMMLVSLVGNACADYALLWYGLHLLSAGSAVTADRLTPYYVGQAIGYIILAPFMSAWFDRLPRRVASIGTEVLYSAVLATMLVLYNLDELSTTAVFLASVALAGLSAVYRSGVTYSVMRLISEKLGQASAVAKYNYVFNFTFVFGAVLSGIVFQYFGFAGCVLIGIATFAPMPWFYLQMFSAERPGARKSAGLIQDFLEGLLAFWNNRVLFNTGVSIGILNISATIFPAVLGIGYYRAFPDRTDLVGVNLAIGMGIGSILIPVFKKYSGRLRSNLFLVIAFLPLMVALTICIIFPNPFVYGVAFILGCCGMTLSNIITGQMRLALVPDAVLSRVNTSYFSLLSVGQIVGAFVVVPMLSTALTAATWIILASYICSCLFAFVAMPRITVGELVRTSK